jgi:hypothetical protein
VVEVGRVTIAAAGRQRIEAEIDRVVGEVTEEIYTDARRYCPIDLGPLYRSLHTRRAAPARWRVVVGTDHWIYVEYPTRPHEIRSTGPWPLRNRRTGQIFGPRVWHPGTQAQPFMRAALYQTRGV